MLFLQPAERIQGSIASYARILLVFCHGDDAVQSGLILRVQWFRMLIPQLMKRREGSIAKHGRIRLVPCHGDDAVQSRLPPCPIYASHALFAKRSEAAIAGFLQGSINLSSPSKGKVRGLFEMLSLVNHSCTPNAERDWNDDQQKRELRATIRIERSAN